MDYNTTRAIIMPSPMEERRAQPYLPTVKQSITISREKGLIIADTDPPSPNPRTTP